jgi:hypothetical protein
MVSCLRAAFPFLVRGGYTSSKGTLVGGLDPFPSNVVPATSCVAPTISIPTTFTVPSGEPGRWHRLLSVPCARLCARLQTPSGLAHDSCCYAGTDTCISMRAACRQG